MFTGVEKQGVKGSLAQPNLNVAQALMGTAKYERSTGLKPVCTSLALIQRVLVSTLLKPQASSLWPQASSLCYVGWAFDA
jgi:hypothetical protein